MQKVGSSWFCTTPFATVAEPLAELFCNVHAKPRRYCHGTSRPGARRPQLELDGVPGVPLIEARFLSILEISPAISTMDVSFCEVAERIRSVIAYFQWLLFSPRYSLDVLGVGLHLLDCLRGVLPAEAD